METTTPELIKDASQQQDARPQKKRNRRILTKGGNQLLEAKFVLDAMLEQGTTLPGEVKKAVATARDTAWDCFKQEQERQMEISF